MNWHWRSPTAAVQARFQQWWQSRLPLSDSILLHQRNVYILPTRPGLMLAATLLILLIGSINYQLNLGYVLTFLLLGCAVVGMYVCHETLRGLQMSLLAPPPQFANMPLQFAIKLSNQRRSARHGIGLAVLQTDSTRHWAWTDVPPQDQASVVLSCAQHKRGLQRLPAISAETRFPLGTFRVWTIWRPAAQVLIFPAPELRPPPLPWGEPLSGNAASHLMQHQGDYDGVRAYRAGDALKLIAWKQSAKAQARGSHDLVSRDREQTQRTKLWLDYAPLYGLDGEQRLSRLCAWVLQADALGLDYGLRLPGNEVQPGHGAAHRHNCLQALALC